MNCNLKIGWSEVSITPDKKIRLAGQFYERISEYVETPISVTTLALVTDDDQLIFSSVDLESIDPYLTRSVRERVGGECPGLDTSKIIIAATHDHTSFVYEGTHDPGLSALSDYLGETPETVPDAPDVMSACESTAFLVERISQSITGAWNNRACGCYATSFGRAAVGLCRRACYFDGSAKMWGDTCTENFMALEGGTDSGIELMFTYDGEKKLTGVVANLACPAQVLEQRSLISSDYWGKVKAMLRKKLGADLMVLGICSPAGDICPRDLVRWVEPETPIRDPNVKHPNPPVRTADPSMYDIGGTLTIGRRISGEILAVLDELDPDSLKNDACLIHRAYPEMELPLRRVTEAENAEARRKLDEFAKTHNGATVDFEANAAMHVYAGTAARYVRQQTESTVACEIHIARFGDIAFASCPFELFLDFANIIRARSPARQTFLSQLACDSKGYLPTERAERGGHYSAYVSSGNVGHEGGYLLVERTLADINDMFGIHPNKNN